MMKTLKLLSVFFLLGISGFSQEKAKYSVSYFLSSTCKICQFYSIEMREIYRDYHKLGFDFVGLFPGKLESDSSLQSFKELYQIPFDLKLDSEKHVKWNATITPEVFVTDSAGEILYHGRIDDAYFSLGKRRARVKNRELRNVLDSLTQGLAVPASHVPAVGCIIEK